MNDNKALNAKKSAPSSPKAANLFFDIFDSLLKAMIIVFIILTFFFKICTVSGPSMKSTLFDGDKIIVSSFAYTPKENDIIVFHQTGNGLYEPVVKRVIATGGKYVKIDYGNKRLYVSEDEVFEESEFVDESSYAFFDSGIYNSRSDTEIYSVPEGMLFVMGDNRNHSTDSRTHIGYLDERRVLGKVFLRFAPDIKTF